MARILDALTSNPAVWAKTVFLVMYDENDGFFDHVLPPVAPRNRSEGLSTVDTAGEFNSHDGAPYGLGPRVPMLVISPWSRGGFVCSEVFDHTSILRFLEARFGVTAENITPWRRAVCGDLQSAFDFATPNQNLPLDLSRIDAAQPLTTNGEFQKFRATYMAKPKASAVVGQPMPKPEGGRRRVRPLGYELDVVDEVDRGGVRLQFHNTGRLGAVFHVHDLSRPDVAARRYTVSAGATLSDVWPSANGAYALLVHGPVGFTRRFEGHVRNALQAKMEYKVLLLRNAGPVRQQVEISGQLKRQILGPGEQVTLPVTARDGWYNFDIRSWDFVRYFAGKWEDGRSGWSDPSLI